MAWLRRPPREWKIINELAVIRSRDGKQIGTIYVLKDQYGNIKKRVTV